MQVFLILEMWELSAELRMVSQGSTSLYDMHTQACVYMHAQACRLQGLYAFCQAVNGAGSGTAT